MDTKKIMYENRNRYKRFEFHISDNTIVLITDCIKRPGGLIWSKRSKQDLGMSVRVCGTDIVLYVLGFSGKRIVHLTI